VIVSKLFVSFASRLCWFRVRVFLLFLMYFWMLLFGLVLRLRVSVCAFLRDAGLLR